MCDYKKLSIDFLIQCYFGDVTDDPVLAAIDKAYIDMQTHTVKVEKGRENALFNIRFFFICSKTILYNYICNK